MNEALIKVAVITMARRLEFPAAWSSLKTVESQLGPNTRHFLLLNDERDSEIEAALRSRPYTAVLAPGKNLGVAAGRNTLITAALEWGAQIIISLDDDLLVPSDFVLRIRDWIVKRVADGERIGIVAPAVLDFHAVAAETMTEEDILEAELGGLQDFWDTRTLRTRIRRVWEDDLPVEVLYHAGIRKWRQHYLESYRSRAAKIRTLYLNSRGMRDEGVGLTEMRLDPDTRKAILTGGGSPVPIDTAAGGACAYTAALLRTIGGIDEAFSPFGYEDSDFAIRSLAAGFNNYTLPTEILLHDLDSRQKTRSPAILLHSQGRSRALIARKHVPQRERVRAMTEIACLAPLQAVDLVGATSSHFPSPTGGAIGSVVAYMAGFVEGLFIPPAEPDLGGSMRSNGYSAVPHRMEGHTTFKYRSWSGSPISGLPRVIPVDVTIAYTWNVDTTRFTLHRLVADAPGLIRITLSAEIQGVGVRDELGNPDPLSRQLIHAELEVEDWGFLRRFQTTAAWFRRERSPGYFSSLVRSPSSRMARALQWFLSLRKAPAHIKISIDPLTPISVGELYEQTPGVNQNRRLGLTTMVNHTTHY